MRCTLVYFLLQKDLWKVTFGAIKCSILEIQAFHLCISADGRHSVGVALKNISGLLPFCVSILGRQCRRDKKAEKGARIAKGQSQDLRS